MLAQNTGAVISIAFVMAVVTASIPQEVLFKIFSGITSGLSADEPRALHRQHAHRAVGAGRDVADRRVVCLLRPTPPGAFPYGPGGTR